MESKPEPVSSNKEDEKYDKWKVEDAARTLLQAEEVKQDKKLHDLALKELSKKKQAICSISELHDAKNRDADEEIEKRDSVDYDEDED